MQNNEDDEDDVWSAEIEWVLDRNIMTLKPLAGFPNLTFSCIHCQ